jgi:hypothetical protein
MFGVLGNLTEGYSARPGQPMLDDTVHSDTKTCFDGDVMERLRKGDLCVLGTKRDLSPDFILWGDSHADALFPLFKRMAMESQTFGVFVGEAGCRPLLGIERHDGHLACKQFNRAVFDYVIREKIQNVFLVGRWELALGVNSYEVATGAEEVFFSDDVSSTLSLEENVSTFKRSFRTTISSLSSAKKNVWVVLSPPEPSVRIPQWLAARSSEIDTLDPRLNMEEGILRHEIIRDTFAIIAADYGVTIIDPAERLCVENECLIAVNGHNLYRDHKHLSKEGAYFLQSQFLPAFQIVKSTRETGTLLQVQQ